MRRPAAHPGIRTDRGQLDDALSEPGWVQTREAVADRRWDAVVASSMQRCSAFAREFAQARAVPLTLDARLQEYHFGNWQGVPIEDLAETQADALGRFWTDPVAHPPPGAETFAAFATRLSAAMDAIVSAHPAQRVLVVTHGGVIRPLRCIAEARDFSGHGRHRRGACLDPPPAVAGGCESEAAQSGRRGLRLTQLLE